MVTEVLTNVGLPLLLAQSDVPTDYSGGSGGGAVAAVMGGVGGLIGLLVALIIVAGLWKIFTKAGQPGWAAIVPIYNMIVLTKIVGKPMWLAVLLILPCTFFIGWILVSLALAKSFGKEIGFAIGLMFASLIFVPILGFGSAEYKGPAA
jgi:Family of unknown function (DUF5684)